MMWLHTSTQCSTSIFAPPTHSKMTLAIKGSFAVPTTAKGCCWTVRNTGDTVLGGTTVTRVRNDDNGSDYSVISIQAPPKNKEHT